VAELPDLLAMRGDGEVRFDAIVGRGALTPPRSAGTFPDRAQVARVIAGLLRPGGRVSLAEPLPRLGQRLYQLLELRELGPALAERLAAAEEAIYATPGDAMLDWDAGDLRATLEAAGLEDVTIETTESANEVRISPAMLARWFSPAPPDAPPGYAQRLADYLDAEEVKTVRALYEGKLTGKIAPWRSVTAFVTGRRGA
jgi:putative ATPase